MIIWTVEIPTSELGYWGLQGGGGGGGGGRFKNTYELLNRRAVTFSPGNKIHIFQCMGKIFCMEFQKYPLKFYRKYLTHTLKGMINIQHCNFRALTFKSSYAFFKRPRVLIRNNPFHLFLYGFENDAGLLRWNCVDTTNTYMYIWDLLV